MIDTNRIKALDGLRGVAALAVYVSHCVAIALNPSFEKTSPSTLQWIGWHFGAPAVDLFFVLSGFVLARSLATRPVTNGQQYASYAASRAIRLLPIAWIAVIAGLGLRTLSGRYPLPSGAGLTLTLLQEPLTIADWIGFVTMLAPASNMLIVNVPLWTMPVEMLASLLMPLFVLLGHRLSWGLVPLVIVEGYAASIITGLQGFGLSAAFALGVVIQQKRTDFSQILPYPALVAGLLILLMRHFTGFDDIRWRWITMLGAGLVIIAVDRGALSRILKVPALQFMGKVSYAFYALHYVVLASFVLVIGDRMTIAESTLLALPASLFVAWIMTALVDERATQASAIVRRHVPRKTTPLTL